MFDADLFKFKFIIVIVVFVVFGLLRALHRIASLRSTAYPARSGCNGSGMWWAGQFIARRCDDLVKFLKLSTGFQLDARDETKFSWLIQLKGFLERFKTN